MRIAEYARCNGRVLHDGIRDDVGCGTRLGSCLLHGCLADHCGEWLRVTRELILVGFVRIEDSTQLAFEHKTTRIYKSSTQLLSV